MLRDKPKSRTFDFGGPADGNVFEDIDSTADELGIPVKHGTGNAYSRIRHKPRSVLRRLRAWLRRRL